MTEASIPVCLIDLYDNSPPLGIGLTYIQSLCPAGNFQDDEGRSRLGGKPRHPIISSVLYLSGGHVGGPTMVSDQVLGANLASKGWLVYPKENRCA